MKSVERKWKRKTNENLTVHAPAPRWNPSVYELHSKVSLVPQKARFEDMNSTPGRKNAAVDSSQPPPAWGTGRQWHCPMAPPVPLAGLCLYSSLPHVSFAIQIPKSPEKCQTVLWELLFSGLSISKCVLHIFDFKKIFLCSGTLKLSIFPRS